MQQIDPGEAVQTPECPAELAAFYRNCCRGDAEAFKFLLSFHLLIHRIDDLVDEGEGPEALIAAFVLAQVTLAMPFYRAHEAELRLVWMLVANAYADSVQWEKSEREACQRIADVARFAGNEMVRAVAMICGGWEHLRVVSPMLWALSWAGHHDAEGKPV